MRRYRDNLDFYEGRQWPGRARRGERRLTFNYAKAFADKITGYLLTGLSVQVEARDGDTAAGRDRARAAELALREVEATNGLSQLDFETELDCAVLGDACYKVTWDAAERQVRVTAPDVQGIYAWRVPDDPSRLTAVASQYQVEEPGASSLRPAPTTVTEYWTAEAFEVWHGEALARREANPYGVIPFVLFPNVREPKQAWGTSDLPPLVESARELNRAYSQLSQILELSGNPIAVLEGVSRARRLHGGMARAMLGVALQKALPFAVAGLVVTWNVCTFAMESAWMLPGLWQILLGLLGFAALANLPREIAWVAGWYLCCGAVVLALAGEARVLSPWMMGIPLGVGQLAVAAILLRADAEGRSDE